MVNRRSFQTTWAASLTTLALILSTSPCTAAPADPQPEVDIDTPRDVSPASKPAATPVTRPAFRFSLGVADVVKLHERDIGMEVILAYIEQTGIPYYLGAEEIIHLRDLGLPSSLIVAMIQQGARVQQRNAAANRMAPPQIPPTPTALTVTPASPPAPRREVVTAIQPYYVQVPAPYPVYSYPSYSYSYGYYPYFAFSYYGSFGHRRPYYHYRGAYPSHGRYGGHHAWNGGWGRSFHGYGRGGYGHGHGHAGFGRVSFGGRGSWVAPGGRHHH